jgi:hypothetical protein
MKQILLVLGAVLTLSTWSWGQTSQPSPPEAADGNASPAAQTTVPVLTGWPRVMQQCAHALMTANPTALQSLSDPTLVIKQINGSQMEDTSRLMAQVSNEVLRGVHSYFYPPLSMAADIAVDAKNAARMPEHLKRKMIPADDAAMKEANATAAQWIAELLGVTDDEPVGVILFWCDGTANDKILGLRPQVVFVLVKGREVAKGQFKLQTIAFGNPVSDRR